MPTRCIPQYQHMDESLFMCTTTSSMDERVCDFTTVNKNCVAIESFNNLLNFQIRIQIISKVRNTIRNYIVELTKMIL
jgi:hypothetical protein